MGGRVDLESRLDWRCSVMLAALLHDMHGPRLRNALAIYVLNLYRSCKQF